MDRKQQRNWEFKAETFALSILHPARSLWRTIKGEACISVNITIASHRPQLCDWRSQSHGSANKLVCLNRCFPRWLIRYLCVGATSAVDHQHSVGCNPSGATIGNRLPDGCLQARQWRQMPLLTAVAFELMACPHAMGTKAFLHPHRDWRKPANL